MERRGWMTWVERVRRVSASQMPVTLDKRLSLMRRNRTVLRAAMYTSSRCIRRPRLGVPNCNTHTSARKLGPVR